MVNKVESKLTKNELGYYRHTTYGIGEVMNLIEDYINFEDSHDNRMVREYDKRGHLKGNNKIEYKGEVFKVGGYRLLTFYEDGVVCRKCKIEGKFFSLDNTKQGDGKHLNLVGIDEEGKERLMTSDHIHPKSLGGSDDLENRQTLCSNCNIKKDNKVEDK